MDPVTLTSLVAPTASSAVKSSTGAQVIKVLQKLPNPDTVRAQAIQAAGKRNTINIKA